MINHFPIPGDAVSNQNTGGFRDGNTNPALNDYEYDNNGNMVKDRNKGIESITYNHLNLPTKIIRWRGFLIRAFPMPDGADFQSVPFLLKTLRN